jgi:hypothetical protein
MNIFLGAFDKQAELQRAFGPKQWLLRGILPVVLAGVLCSCSTHERELTTSLPSAIPVYTAVPTMEFVSEANFQLLDAGGRIIQSGFAWLTVDANALRTEISPREAVDQSGRVLIKLDDRFRERLAIKSQGTLWVVDNQYRINGADIPADAFSSKSNIIEVRLSAVRDLAAVTVLDSFGSLVVHAKVAADTLGFLPRDVGQKVPHDVWAAACMLTDSKGQCFADLPTGQLNPYVRIEADGWGTQVLPVTGPGKDGKHVFRLGKCEQVTTSLVGDSPASVRLLAISRFASGHLALKTFHLDPGEEAKCLLLAGDELVLRPQILGESDRIAFVDQAPARILEGSSTQLNIRVKRGISVRGTIVKGPDHVPVIGARLTFSGSAISDDKNAFVEVISGADGGYQLR